MKKQLLTLAMCLAVTSAGAIAATPATKAACPVKPVAATVAKKAPEKCTEAAKPTPEQMKKEFEARMVKERELLYNNLNLTKEQRATAEELHKKNMAAGMPLMEKVRVEKMKLYELKAKKACEADINKQKVAVKEARKDFKKHMKAAHKDFEAILTKEQKAKLDVIKAERKAEMKKFKKGKGKHEFGPCPMGPKPPVGPDGKMMPPPPPYGMEGPMPPKCPCEK